MVKKIFDSKVFKIIFGFVKALFILLLVAYLAFVLIQRFSGNESVLGYRLFTVASGSMSGVYEIDDVIAVKDWDNSKYKVGDDIAYKGEKGGMKGLLITHRIIKIEKDKNGDRVYTTKGVNSTVEDPTIVDRQILGKVVGKVPVITQLNHITKDRNGFFFLIFCPLLLVIIIEVIRTVIEIKHVKSELNEGTKAEETEKSLVNEQNVMATNHDSSSEIFSFDNQAQEIINEKNDIIGYNDNRDAIESGEILGSPMQKTDSQKQVIEENNFNQDKLVDKKVEEEEEEII